MKRLQIMIDEDLDDALDSISAAEGVSKAAVIRRVVRRALQPLPPLEDDAVGRMAGADDFEPADIDDVVYR
jgi:metal-responsive CopG/Arc/MetJ family transcriptional regulator